MKKFMEFAKKYNLLDLFLILLLILIIYPIFFAKQSTYLVDYGREAYVPWQMLNGEVLYKDIFNVYGPLGYQINAFAYKIFGVNLSTLYGLSFVNSFLISSFVYMISKIFLNRKISLCVTGVVITYCIYYVGVHNLMMPYSFNAVYALSSALVSIYAMLLYLKEKKSRNLILSFLFAGFSFANKIEYIPYFGFLFLLLPFIIEDKKDWKSYIAPVCAFSVFPIISFGILFLQGVSVSDLFNAVGLMKKLVDAPATQYFYNKFGLYFNPGLFVFSLTLFWKFFVKVLPLVIIFYGLNFVGFKYIQSKFIKIIFNIFVFILSLVFVKFYVLDYYLSTVVFSWIGILVLVTAVGFLIYEILKLHKIKISEAEKSGIMFLFLCVSSILLSFKGFFHISQQAYGTLSIPILIIPIYVIFSNLPLVLRKINFGVWNKTVINLTFIGVLVFFATNIERLVSFGNGYAKTTRGNIFTWQFVGQNSLINYIKNNTPKDSTLVVLPEGAIINFLAERKSHNIYYYLIPVNVQVFGEEKILSDFKQNAPDYFVVDNIPYTPYNVGTFIDYAPEITKFINENYYPVYKINDKVTFVLYKKK